MTRTISRDRPDPADPIGTVYQRDSATFKLTTFSTTGAPCYVRWIKTTKKWSGTARQYDMRTATKVNPSPRP